MGNEASSQGPRGLQSNEIAVLKANSNLSEQQIREYYNEFKADCPSGRMNLQQFRKSFRSFVNDDKKAAFADQLFPVFDKNGDGTVDFSEFVLSCGLGGKGDLDSQLDLAFSMIDTSRDGNITFQEMTHFSEYAKKIGNDRSVANMSPVEIATVIFDAFNLDRTQKLSKQQFIQGCKTTPQLREIFT